MSQDRRQTASYAVIAAFMVVTIGHVAAFTGSMEPDGWEWLGWPYALAVDFSIAVCAWLTRWATTKRWAWLGFFAFAAASGALNVAHVAPWSQRSPLGAWIYSLFPTAAIALLGFLARDAELLAERSARVRGKRAHEEPPNDADVAESKMPGATFAAECEICEWSRNGYESERAARNALNAHQRIHKESRP
jgi:hypothetical protein